MNDKSGLQKNYYLAGGPVLNLLIWVALRLYMHDPGPEEEVLINCPFFEKTNVDSYVFEIPLFAILFSNTFFLIWIMVVRKLLTLATAGLTCG